jgi:hypothetical protein
MTDLTLVNPVRFPDDTPGDVGANVDTMSRNAERALLECRLCQDEGRTTEFVAILTPTVDAECVTAIAAHLFTQHGMMHLVKAGRGEDSCRCQFCNHRRTCTTPGDVECKRGPSND